MNRCEKLVSDAEVILRARQICTFYKIPNDLETLRQTPCDFIGHTIKGQGIMLEAKSTAAPRLAVPHKRGIKGHQWAALRDAYRCGSLSAIVWLHNEEICALPFMDASSLLISRKSIPWPGGATLDGLDPDQATLVVVGALIDCFKAQRYAI